MIFGKIVGSERICAEIIKKILKIDLNTPRILEYFAFLQLYDFVGLGLKKIISAVIQLVDGSLEFLYR